MSEPIDILVIDDEQVVRDAVSRVCEAAGLTVETAFDARSGLEKVQKKEYRLVLCDVMLPGLDAFQVLDEMKRAGIRTPVIMITGYSTVENAVNSLKKGAIDFVPKPFTTDELESAVRRGLRYREGPRSESLSGFQIDDASTLHVPSSPAYYRLGYLSWAFIEPNGTGLIGMTHEYLKTVSPLKEIRCFDTDDDVVQGSVCARVVSTDMLVHDVLSPLSGKILERNHALLTSPETAENDPYLSGWLYRIIPTEVAYELMRLTPCIQDQ